jgi:hypothetical protein
VEEAAVEAAVIGAAVLALEQTLAQPVVAVLGISTRCKH